MSSPGDGTVRLGNGIPVVAASLGQVFGTWLLDFVVVVGFAAAVAALGHEPGTNGLGAVIVTAVMVAFVVALLYGFLSAGGRSLGSLVFGTRLVSARDGAHPRFWARGFLMFRRAVLWPLWPFLFLAAALQGSGESMVEQKPRFLLLDERAAG
jgi:RDD family